MHVYDFEQDADTMARQIARSAPLLVGFSLIFQFYVRGYGALVELLRAARHRAATSRWAGTSRA